MSPKKTKRSQAAQQLIENLLDELPPQGKSSTPPSGSEPLAFGERTGSFGPVVKESGGNPIFEGIDENDDSLHLEHSQEVVLDPVAKAHQEHMTRVNATRVNEAPRAQSKESTPSEPKASTAKAPKPPPPPSNVSPIRTRAPDVSSRQTSESIDFGAMSSEDDANARTTVLPSIAAERERERESKQQQEQRPTASSQTPPVPTSSGPKSAPAPKPMAEVPFEDTAKVRAEARTMVAEPMPRTSANTSASEAFAKSIDRGGATEIRSGVKIPPAPRSAGLANVPFTSAEATLKQSESLRIAQNRITDLEKELERVRRDNDALSTAGDTLRRHADELAGKAENLEIQAKEANIRLEEEKKVLRSQIHAKERENAEMRARVEEIEARLESNFKKIRVRERELEHRLEIVKVENSTLVTTKDKMLLDLKRQIDQLHQESDSAKNKTQELFAQYKDKQETIRRVVRALRIALTILEGDDETIVPFKKAE